MAWPWIVLPYMELEDFESNNPNQQRTIGGQIRTNKTSFKKQTMWFARQKTNQKILRTARSVSIWIPHDSESKTNHPVASLKRPSHTWFPMLCIATTLQLFRVVKKATVYMHVCVYNYMYTYHPKEHLFFFYLFFNRSQGVPWVQHVQMIARAVQRNIWEIYSSKKGYVAGPPRSKHVEHNVQPFFRCCMNIAKPATLPFSIPK